MVSVYVSAGFCTFSVSCVLGASAFASSLTYFSSLTVSVPTLPCPYGA